MQVIGFVGSPRVGGNTETLVAEVLRGAASVGAGVEQVTLNKLKITPCQGCDACKKLKHCRLNDDMLPLHAKLLAADVIVVGTPIYFWGPSAQTKAFLDRWYALDQEGLREKFVGKRLQLVCAFGDSDQSTADATVLMMRNATNWLDMEMATPLLVTANDRGEVAQNAEAMQRAFQIGIGLGRSF